MTERASGFSKNMPADRRCGPFGWGGNANGGTQREWGRVAPVNNRRAACQAAPQRECVGRLGVQVRYPEQGSRGNGGTPSKAAGLRRRSPLRGGGEAWRGGVAARRVPHPRGSRPAASAVSRALKEVRWSLPARG